MFAQEWRSIGVKNITSFGVRPVWKGRSAKEKLMMEVYLRRGFIGTRKEEEECPKWIQENTGEAPPQGRLCGFNRPLTSLLPCPRTQRFHYLPCFRLRREDIRIQRSPLRLQRCSTNIYKADEEGYAAGSEKVEWKMFELYRRHYHFARGQRRLAESCNRNRSLVQQSRTCCQRREEQVNSKKNLLLPWLDMEDSCDEGLSGDEAQVLVAKENKTVDEFGIEGNIDNDNRLRITRWRNQRNSIRLRRRFSAHEQIVQGTQQRSHVNRLDWCDESEPFNQGTAAILENETEKEEGKTFQAQCQKDSSEIGQHLRCLRAINLPGAKNLTVDALSRLQRAGDYEITDEVLRELEHRLDLTIEQDAFASATNRKTMTWFGPGSPELEDGLQAGWKGAVTLVHLTIPLILPCFMKIREEQARAVILLPAWKLQVWTPLLREMTTSHMRWSDSRKILRACPGMKRLGASHLPGPF
ncbi:uncharacterized protein MONOS_10876 [Monocercomonoides exilis]|uniref:uncharacterized protein n=1 Tax=Monocercomonoides exilis TaxID=2049356 RepID=UPI003559D88F|nr:hypothetical protein MONOS_10876 [Monocercomonoides exilis]|eukprot:MONOS_10876.1-p1 / transcript=MONOS_10876.1 / gene=MONOS_10876 / organism=Monocercomonoides_exilis_PA203 / gene_product=unspecified product / transcript_product=unspecified product / location=Mono_scaffold00514:18753-20606(-) / protein_length=469 / sequence_SO=supercontig / SO=protein_coding / is_pseudo=false